MSERRLSTAALPSQCRLSVALRAASVLSVLSRIRVFAQFRVFGADHEGEQQEADGGFDNVGYVMDAASLGMALLTGLVIVRGDQTELRPLETSPAAGDTSVSTRPLITLRYRGRLDPASGDCDQADDGDDEPTRQGSPERRPDESSEGVDHGFHLAHALSFGDLA